MLGAATPSANPEQVPLLGATFMLGQQSRLQPNPSPHPSPHPNPHPHPNPNANPNPNPKINPNPNPKPSPSSNPNPNANANQANRACYSQRASNPSPDLLPEAVS